MADITHFEGDGRQSDLRTLVWGAQQGTITETDFSRLDTLLQTNDEYRQQYVRYLRLMADLQFDVAFQPEVALPMEHVAPTPRRVLNVSRVVGIAASLLLIGYFAALAGLVIWDQIHPRDLRNDVAIQSSAGQFAKLVRMQDCAWETNSAPAAVGAWLPRNVVHLQKGTVELQFADGARVIVEGPAKFEPRGADRAFLSVGKLVATVPKQAIGFTIDTPTATIVDLGTEFGVETNPQSTEIQVFKGKVEVRPDSKRGDTSSAAKIILVEGTARRVEADRQNDTVVVREVAPKANRFARQLSSAPSGDEQPIRVEGAFSPNSYPGAELDISHLIRGHGLTGNRHSSNWRYTMWHTAFGQVKDVLVLFDFARPFRLNSMKVWNFNAVEGDEYLWLGVKQADVYVSMSGKGDPLSKPADWKLIVADQQFAPGTGKDDYDTPTVLPLGDIEGRFVAIVIDKALGSNPNDLDVVGLSEVQFFGSRVEAPNPSARKPNK
jgi:ferric-dicitrate binding protein FerR (iron transport regulator)